MSMMNTAQVYIWNTFVGQVIWNKQYGRTSFKYSPNFLLMSVELSPLKMPNRKKVFYFKKLGHMKHKIYPDILADFLSEKLENFINLYPSLNPVERLCEIGERGMGALEFHAGSYDGSDKILPIKIKKILRASAKKLRDGNKVKGNLKTHNQKEIKNTLKRLLKVDVCAGGSRAKCIFAMNEKTGEIRSGHTASPHNYTYWLMKFDGLLSRQSKRFHKSNGFCNIEYAYYLMALECGIEMTKGKLLIENGRSHFMAKRFDRIDGGEKLHVQSLFALARFDFHRAGVYSYEQVMVIIKKIVSVGRQRSLVQQFRRAVFNIIGRNQDDHTKNIAFIMDKSGAWKLSSAFDLSYNYNPKGKWTAKHQMSLNGKCENIEIKDLLALSKYAGLSKARALAIIKKINTVVSHWEIFAKKAGVSLKHCEEVKSHLYLFKESVLPP